MEKNIPRRIRWWSSIPFFFASCVSRSSHPADSRGSEALLVEAQALVLALRAGALPAPIVLEPVGGSPVHGAFYSLVPRRPRCLVACLALAAVAAAGYRAAGALWVLVGAALGAVIALALTSLPGVTASGPCCMGLASAVVIF